MDVKCDFSILDRTFFGKYSCKVEKVVKSQEKKYALKWTGDHLPGMNNNDVDCIEFSWMSLENFPRELSEVFPKTKNILISYCKVKSITREDLAGFKKLSAFQAKYNNIKSIPSDLFIDMPNLRHIDLSYNQIEFVSSKVLEPLLGNDLLLVDFSFNTNIHYRFGKYHHETSLQKLMNIMDTNCVRPFEEKLSNKEIFVNEYAEQLAMLWTTGRYSDFTIIAADGSTEFRVHKFALGLQSSVFAEIFGIKTEDQQRGKLTIKDFSSGAVEEFLRLFYFDRIKNETYAMELFSLAGTYKVEKLKSMMEEIILEKVNESNAFETLSFGCLQSSAVIKNKAFEVVKKIFQGSQLCEDLKEQPEVLKELLEASNVRKRKVKEADDEFNSLLKKYNKKGA